MNQKHLLINPEVKAALEANRPVVALESTIISHGFPYPDNLHGAKRCEEIIRENGAVPATIAILDGKLCVGLDNDQLLRLAQSPDIAKASRRDVAAIVASKSSAATTVATTMMIAHMAGIKVFCTGGIGGVHRGYEDTLDVSADLQELANTPVTVVCAGAKSILDLPRTREYLETFGVPVLGYRTSVFPAFFVPKSSEKVDYAFDTAREIAEVMRSHAELSLRGGILLCNPIPEKDALEGEFFDDLLQKALAACKSSGVRGKETTPFLLAFLHKHSDGATIKANQALVYNNAEVAAQVAVAYANLN